MVPEPSSCDLWMHTTWAGSVVTRTLLFHTYYSHAGSVIGSCTHNHTTYLVCSHGNQHICFNPTYRPQEQWLEIRSVCNPGNLISHTQVFSTVEPVSVFFDACAVIDQGSCGGIGCGCGGLTWERAYMSNVKYMCQGDDNWPYDNVGSYYCPYWGCISWACTTVPSLSIEVGLPNSFTYLFIYLPGLTWNNDPPTLSLPSS
jgi:hypothetical protein